MLSLDAANVLGGGEQPLNERRPSLATLISFENRRGSMNTDTDRHDDRELILFGLFYYAAGASHQSLYCDITLWKLLEFLEYFYLSNSEYM